jgi:hypothetical protein
VAFDRRFVPFDRFGLEQKKAAGHLSFRHRQPKRGSPACSGKTPSHQRKRSRLPSLRHLKLSVTLKSIRLSHFEPVDNKQLQALINRKPFRAFEIATTAGDHFPVLEEGDILNNRRRPELYFIFTEDGLAHWIEADDIVSVTTL